VLFISSIWCLFINNLKKSFYPDEKYDYINRTKSLAGAAEAQGSADSTADKEVKTGAGVTRFGVVAQARDGRGALPYPTPPMYPKP
jgi:hypothetical protein